MAADVEGFKKLEDGTTVRNEEGTEYPELSIEEIVMLF